MKAKEFFKSDKFKYILVIISAIIIYILVYGYRIINPCYTEWLLFRGLDNSQHYLGWKAYRESAWHFPLGMVDTLMYPYFNSVIFTDSIPLFAVFFKLLSPILPKDFQYFGIWGLMCFILQGVLTAKIVKNYTKNTATCHAKGSNFFLISRKHLSVNSNIESFNESSYIIISSIFFLFAKVLVSNLIPRS